MRAGSGGSEISQSDDKKDPAHSLPDEAREHGIRNISDARQMRAEKQRDASID